LRTSPFDATTAKLIVKMFYDLNVPWSNSYRELQRVVAFLDECKQMEAALLVAALTFSAQSCAGALISSVQV
jgi:hypothetical protein